LSLIVKLAKDFAKSMNCYDEFIMEDSESCKADGADCNRTMESGSIQSGMPQNSLDQGAIDNTDDPTSSIHISTDPERILESETDSQILIELQ
jgi:hypothetical protein